jgi:hypothetical protein
MKGITLDNQIARAHIAARDRNGTLFKPIARPLEKGTDTAIEAGPC